MVAVCLLEKRVVLFDKIVNVNKRRKNNTWGIGTGKMSIRLEDVKLEKRVRMYLGKRISAYLLSWLQTVVCLTQYHLPEQFIITSSSLALKVAARYVGASMLFRTSVVGIFP